MTESGPGRLTIGGLAKASFRFEAGSSSEKIGRRPPPDAFVLEARDEDVELGCASQERKIANPRLT